MPNRDDIFTTAVFNVHKKEHIHSTTWRVKNISINELFFYQNMVFNVNKSQHKYIVCFICHGLGY